MTPVPPLDENQLKSYPYFWNWLQELDRDWQEVTGVGIESTPVEIWPNDNGWRQFIPNDCFTATLTFSDGINIHREGKWSEGKMTYIPFQEPAELDRDMLNLLADTIPLEDKA